MRGGLTEKNTRSHKALFQKGTVLGLKDRPCYRRAKRTESTGDFCRYDRAEEIIKEAPGNYRYIGTSRLWKKKSDLNRQDF